MTPVYTFAETRERLLTALDAAPTTVFTDGENCTYFITVPNNGVKPLPGYTPSCAVGHAFADILRPIVHKNYFNYNGASIDRLIRAELPGQFDEAAIELLIFAQDMNDEGCPWSEIADAIRTDYPDPTPVTKETRHDLTHA